MRVHEALATAHRSGLSMLLAIDGVGARLPYTVAKLWRTQVA